MDDDNAEGFHSLLKIGAIDVMGLVRCSEASPYQRLLASLSNQSHLKKLIAQVDYEKRRKIFQHSSFSRILCRNLAQKIASSKPEIVIASSLASLNFAKFVADHLALINQDIVGSVPVYAYDLNSDFIPMSKRWRGISSYRGVIVSNFISNHALEKDVQNSLLKSFGCKTVCMGSLFENQRNRLMEDCRESNVYHAVDIKDHLKKLTECEKCADILKL